MSQHYRFLISSSIRRPRGKFNFSTIYTDKCLNRSITNRNCNFDADGSIRVRIFMFDNKAFSSRFPPLRLPVFSRFRFKRNTYNEFSRGQTSSGKCAHSFVSRYRFPVELRGSGLFFRFAQTEVSIFVPSVPSLFLPSCSTLDHSWRIFRDWDALILMEGFLPSRDNFEGISNEQ